MLVVKGGGGRMTRCLLTLYLASNLVYSLVHVPDVLINEKNDGQPGVKARLSRKGVNYIASFLANSLVPELIDLKLDISPQELEVDNGVASITDMNLKMNKPPVTILTDLKAPNLIILTLQGMDVAAKASLNGKIFGRNLSGTAILTSPNLKALLSVALSANVQGSPNIKIEQCKVRGPLDITLQNVPEQSKRPLQESLKTEGLGLLEGFICSRIEFLAEQRINTRFGFMNPKITMAALTKQLDDQEILNDVIARLKATRVSKREIMYYHTEDRMHRRAPRGANLIDSFNVSRADTLFLDYTIRDVRATNLGLEVDSGGEVSLNGRGGTPFGPVNFSLPTRVNEDTMLQLLISDFMTNSLLYHGHTIGLFDTRIDPKTPHIGSILRTTCSLSTGLLFCLGDMFPTLKRTYPNQFLSLSFNTVQAPVIMFKPPNAGGITFTLFGKISMSLLEDHNETQVAEMGIAVNAKMQMRLTNTVVKPKLTFNLIKLTTLSPGVLLQDELDDAVMLAREVIQRLVNDILKDGIPIPIHPLFKLNKPMVRVMNRAILINTNFNLNESLMKQLISADFEKLVRA